MLDELAKIREDALKRLENIKSEEELSELNTSVLGRNGALTAILRTMGKLSAERRAQLGKAANEVKQSIAEALEARKAMLDAFAEQKINQAHPSLRDECAFLVVPPCFTARNVPNASAKLRSQTAAVQGCLKKTLSGLTRQRLHICPGLNPLLSVNEPEEYRRTRHGANSRFGRQNFTAAAPERTL